MRARLGTILHAGLLALATLATPFPAAAQIADQIDGARLEQWRLRTGNQLRICRYPASTTAAFDEAAGRAIAERLLLTPVFVDMKDGYSIGSEFAGEDFYVALTNDCDLALTMAIAPGAFPQEFTVTRPIAAFSYILVTDDPDYTALSDIPPGLAVGGSMMSYGDYIFGVHLRSLPEEKRLQRFPYGTNAQMLERLRDGTIEAMILYAPGYHRLRAEQPAETEGLRVIDFDVAQSPMMNRGGVMLAQNAFLRMEIDAAIAEMIADGGLEAILEETGMAQYPVAVGGI